MKGILQVAFPTVFFCSCLCFHSQQSPQAFSPLYYHLLLPLWNSTIREPDSWGWSSPAFTLVPIWEISSMGFWTSGTLGSDSPVPAASIPVRSRRPLAERSFSKSCLFSSFGLLTLSSDDHPTDMPFDYLFCILGHNSCSPGVPCPFFLIALSFKEGHKITTLFFGCFVPIFVFPPGSACFPSVYFLPHSFCF